MGDRCGPSVLWSTPGRTEGLIGSRPDRALELSQDINSMQVAPNSRQRYALDRVTAHARLKNTDKATEIMMGLKRDAPVWLRNQRTARYLAEDLLQEATRMPSAEHREIADFLGVTG